MLSESKPDRYGTSLHYTGQSGKKYLAYQDLRGEINGFINARKFKDLNVSRSIVLDFGAGTGNLLNALQPMKAIAVEVNPYALEKLRSRGIESHSYLDNIDANSIDIVISNHALEHVPYPISALSEIRRVLKPGGILRLCVPIDDWRSEKRYKQNDVNHHLHTWSPQLLGNSLQEAGFDPAKISLRIFTHAWFPGYQYLFRWPLFDLACYFHAILRKRRQIIAEVTK